MIRPFVLTYLLLSLLAVASHAQWIKQSVNTTASLRGLSVVNEKVVWASGTGGTVIRTVDGGEKWDVIVVPGAEKLDFRDIEAFNANTAYILSIGNGELSRIYKTTDGGEHWRLEFQNSDPKAFYDAIACWDSEHCLAMSDPVDGMFVINVRSPGQIGFSRKAPSWIHAVRHVAGANGEASFAASGTCLIAVGNYNPFSIATGIAKNDAFIVTGGNAARVLRTADGGLSWAAAETTITKGTQGSGIFGIAMFDAKSGVIVGGNYENPNEAKDNISLTADGGQTWKLGKGLSGYRSGVTYVDKKTIIAVGTNGSDIARDGGKTWKVLGKEDLNAVASKGKRATWAVGPKGLVVKLK